MAIADLCTLSEFRAYINPNRTDPGAGADDVDGALAITAASDALRHSTGRLLELQTAALDRYFTAVTPYSTALGVLGQYYPWPGVFPFTAFTSGLPAPVLMVNDFVLTNQTLAAITVTDKTTLTTYTPAYAYPYNADAKSMAFTGLVFAPGTALSNAEGQLKVNAKWGWVTLPTTIKNACLLQASRYLKRRDTPSGQVQGVAEMGSVVRTRPGLDPDIELMLTDFRRWWAAA